MTEEDNSKKRKHILPIDSLVNIAHTAASARAELSSPAPRAPELSEDRCTENPEDRTTRWCLQSTADCFQKCFYAVKTMIMHNEDDTNFRFRDGKACIVGEPSGLNPPVWMLLDRNISKIASSEHSLASRKSESKSPSKPQVDAKVEKEQPPANTAVSKNFKNGDTLDEGINAISLDDREATIVEGECESALDLFVKNKSVLLELEPGLVSTKKKSSILNNVPKMETIPEGEQFSSFPIVVSKIQNEDEESNSMKIELDDEHDVSAKKDLSVSSTSFHVRFDDLLSDDSVTDSNDAILDLLVRMHEPSMSIWLATTGDFDGLRRALNIGMSIREVDHLGRGLLHLAVLSGSLRTILLLLDLGADPNSVDGMGNTPLFYSLLKKPSVSITKLLLDHGAVIPLRKAPTDIGLFLEFVIMTKPTTQESQLITVLLEHGASLDDPGAPGGRQALHYAAMSNNYMLIRLLTSLGADLHAVNHRGMTPLDVAVFFSCKEAQFCIEDIGIASILTDNRMNQAHSSQNALQTAAT